MTAWPERVQIVVRHATRCRVCRRRILRGSVGLWAKGRGVIHSGCKQQ